MSEMNYLTGPIPFTDILEPGADGELVRTEANMKDFLRMRNYIVQSAEVFGRNDCLIDGLLQSLQHCAMIQGALTFNDRNELAKSVRVFLQQQGHTRSDAYEYLSHDAHSAYILHYLLLEHSAIWNDIREAKQTEFTIIVYDRFHLRRMGSGTEHSFELSLIHISEPTRPY